MNLANLNGTIVALEQEGAEAVQLVGEFAPDVSKITTIGGVLAIIEDVTAHFGEIRKLIVDIANTIHGRAPVSASASVDDSANVETAAKVEKHAGLIGSLEDEVASLFRKHDAIAETVSKLPELVKEQVKAEVPAAVSVAVASNAAGNLPAPGGATVS